MKKALAFRFAALSSAFGVSAALTAFAPAALAQEAKPATSASQAQQPSAAPSSAQAPVPTSAPDTPQPVEEMAEGEEEFIYEPLQVGDATQGLLAWQRSGEIASTTSRPISGAVANRSYERYLKSFEFPIPERMISSVKSSSGSGTAPK